MRIVILITAFILGVVVANAQSLSGRVIDSEGNSVVMATVAVKVDSTFLEATLTDVDGHFELGKIQFPDDAMLNVSHVSYTSKEIKLSEYNDTTIVMGEHALGEVKVSAPLARMESNGAMVFDVNQLTANTSVTNALEILDEIPIVMKRGDGYKLAGTQAVSIIINGRVSTMSQEQVMEMLKSADKDRVKKIEVFYNTPFKYGVNGPSINIVMEKRRGEDSNVRGAIRTTQYQGWYWYQNSAGDIGINGEKWSVDITGGYNTMRNIQEENMESVHTVNGEVKTVKMRDVMDPDKRDPYVNGMASLDVGSEGSLNLTWTLDLKKYDTHSSTTFKDALTGYSKCNRNGKTNVGTLSLGYQDESLMVGVDGAFFHEKEDQKMEEWMMGNGESDKINSKSNQKALLALAYISKDIETDAGTWTLGTMYQTGKSENETDNWSDKYEVEKYNYSLDLNTRDLVFFGGWSKEFGPVSILLQMMLQNSVAKADNDGEKETVWDEWNVFPNLTLSLVTPRENMLQLSVQSDKRYPAYSSLTPTMTFYNAYQRGIGNPTLKPSNLYFMSLEYLINNKYTITGFWNKIDNEIEQYRYQNHDEMIMELKEVNTKKDINWGIEVAMHEAWNDYVATTLSIYWENVIQRLGAVDFQKERKNTYMYLELENNIALNRDKTLMMELNGGYDTKALMSCIFDLKSRWQAGAAMTWKPKNTGLTISARMSDIFGTYSADARIREGVQNVKTCTYDDSRLFRLAVKLNINGFEKKEGREVDTSRF